MDKKDQNWITSQVEKRLKHKMKKREWTKFHLKAEESSKGLIIQQEEFAYIAKKWRLSQDVEKLIDVAIQNGFTNLFRRNNPQKNKLLPTGDGVEHIGFSRDYDEHWWFVVNERSASNKEVREKILRFTVSEKLVDHLQRASISLRGEGRNKDAPEVEFSDYEKVVELLSRSETNMKK